MRKGHERGPLRTILRRVLLSLDLRPSTTYELLECGHLNKPVQDIYGETNAIRRRCWKCKKNLPIDPLPEQT